MDFRAALGQGPVAVQEVERLSEQRDIMMQKAQASEAALDSERQAREFLGMIGQPLTPGTPRA